MATTPSGWVTRLVSTPMTSPPFRPLVLRASLSRPLPTLILPTYLISPFHLPLQVTERHAEVTRIHRRTPNLAPRPYRALGPTTTRAVVKFCACTLPARTHCSNHVRPGANMTDKSTPTQTEEEENVEFYAASFIQRHPVVTNDDD